jgi:prepilin-type N-terminal cleavage/methylation domain-containing protein
MSPKPNTQPPNGFSLLELTLSLALSSIILTAALSTFILQKKVYEKQARIIDIQENIRTGLYMATSELMKAGFDPTGLSGAGIVSARETSLRFTTDFNGDGDVSDSNEDIVYALDETDFQLTRNGQPVAENIHALAFDYYAPDGARLPPPADPGRVKRVGVRIRAENAGVLRTAEAQVTLRNLFPGR